MRVDRMKDTLLETRNILKGKVILKNLNIWRKNIHEWNDLQVMNSDFTTKLL